LGERELALISERGLPCPSFPAKRLGSPFLKVCDHGARSNARCANSEGRRRPRAAIISSAAALYVLRVGARGHTVAPRLGRPIPATDPIAHQFAGYGNEAAHLANYTEQHRKNNEVRITELNKQGLSIRQIAAKVNVSTTTVFKALKRLEIDKGQTETGI